MQYSEYRKIPLLNLFAEFIELPAEIRIKHVKLQIQHGGGFDIFKKQIESLSVEEVTKNLPDHTCHKAISFKN